MMSMARPKNGPSGGASPVPSDGDASSSPAGTANSEQDVTMPMVASVPKRTKKKSKLFRLFGGRSSLSKKLSSRSSRSFTTAGSSSMDMADILDDYSLTAMSSLVLNEDDCCANESNVSGATSGGEASLSSSGRIAVGDAAVEGDGGNTSAATTAPFDSTAEEELERAQRKYDEAVAAVRSHSSGGEADPSSSSSSLRCLVRRSRSDLNRAAARYLEDDVRRARWNVVAPSSSSSSAATSDGDGGSGSGGGSGRQRQKLVDLADRLRTLGQLYDEELGEYGEALRCYSEVLRIETKLLAEARDRLHRHDANSNDGYGDEEEDGGGVERTALMASLTASVQETSRVVGRLRYRIYGAVALPTATAAASSSVSH